ncbi:helix-turn-helix transcriptional regulator [Flavobacterium chungbukense]|uniref:HTH cro/C1-type domain-containing protein n=1 Tax=Flavobacterium chungbukense TaxID=877464 RepID=A0ABP7XUV8_9FLAO|nr:helix-turn-helix transcriptional regulator [Flavobacterium chungbukense]MCC4921577.1 helix-turn-helix transcriptional regulator [Flavobacterium chungbukense]
MEEKKLKQLIEESTLDTTWKENFQYNVDNEEAESYYFEVSLKIIERLEELGWKKSELAEKLGVSKQYISKILRTIQNPSITTIFRIQNVLGIKLIGIPYQEPVNQLKTLVTIKLSSQEKVLEDYNNSYFGEIIYPNQKHITSKWLENQKSSFQCDC